MLKYQLIRTNKEYTLFVTLFDDVEEDEAWTRYEYEKMHKDTLSMMLIELNTRDGTGTVLKTYRA